MFYVLYFSLISQDHIISMSKMTFIKYNVSIALWFGGIHYAGGILGCVWDTMCTKQMLPNIGQVGKFSARTEILNFTKLKLFLAFST